MYTCPVTKRTFDPIRCVRKLNVLSDGQVNTWIDNREKDIERFANEELIVNLVRDVFDLPQWDAETHEGFLDGQVLKLLAAFNEFIAKKV